MIIKTLDAVVLEHVSTVFSLNPRIFILFGAFLSLIRFIIVFCGVPRQNRQRHYLRPDYLQKVAYYVDLFSRIKTYQI